MIFVHISYIISHSVVKFLNLSRPFCNFILFLLTKEIFNIFPFIEYTFVVGKQNVGAGMNTLISTSDGLGPSIFCRKMEKTRPIREEMDGKVV